MDGVTPLSGEESASGDQETEGMGFGDESDDVFGFDVPAAKPAVTSPATGGTIGRRLSRAQSDASLGIISERGRIISGEKVLRVTYLFYY